MGFNWDKYDTGGDFITAAEKKALAEAGAPFNIVNVVERESRFEHDSEYAVTIIVPEGVEGVEAGQRILSFAKGTGAESRDRTLAGLADYLAGEDADEVPAKLVKVGRAWFVKAAA